MAMVQAVDVKKTYVQGKLKVKALDGITLTIEPGEFSALAGPSGSGKTTLLNLMGGLDTVDSGTVVVEEKNITRMSQSALADMRLFKIGFVFQAYNLIPVLSALENVEYVMLLQRVPKKERQERARAILDETGLSGMHHRRPSELSGGQQQRVAVARALVANPSIVLADEPTANLDSATGRGLLEMMKQMNQDKGVTFVFSTHDPMVMDHATRIIRIRDGRVVDDGVKG